MASNMNDSTVAKGIPLFLLKLWKLVNDPSYESWIRWNQNGTSFHIINEVEFSHKLLPQYFKHNNFASFVRQLNKHGFHKLRSAMPMHGSFDQKYDLEFHHVNFTRGHFELLQLIQRHDTVSKRRDNSDDELYAMQKKQRTMDLEIDLLKFQNQDLKNQIDQIRHSTNRQEELMQQVSPVKCPVEFFGSRRSNK